MFLNNYGHILTSICLALSVCALFISLMQSVNGALFLITTFLLPLFGLSPAYT